MRCRFVVFIKQLMLAIRIDYRYALGTLPSNAVSAFFSGGWDIPRLIEKLLSVGRLGCSLTQICRGGKGDADGLSTLAR